MMGIVDDGRHVVIEGRVVFVVGGFVFERWRGIASSFWFSVFLCVGSVK